MKGRGMKQMMMAVTLTVFTAMAGQAQAFQFAEGDTVLAIWGNGTEALYNLSSDVPSFGYGAAPQQLNVAAGLAAAGGSNPIRFSLFSSNSSTERLTSGTANPAAVVQDSSILFSAVANWVPFSNFAGDTIQKANENSFTSRMGGDEGRGFLNGTWDSEVFGSFDDIAGGSNVMTVLGFQFGLGQQTIGHLRMTEAGLVEWQRDAFGGGPVVPVPAAVWLFGTGLVGLVGLARRRSQSAA